MKRTDIGKDRIYTNGKGRFRIVLEEFDSLRFADAACVRYRPYRLNKKDRMVLDYGAMDFGERGKDDRQAGSCTTTSFASWAKAEVLSEDAEGNSVQGHHDVARIEQSRASR